MNSDSVAGFTDALFYHVFDFDWLQNIVSHLTSYLQMK